MAFQKMNYLKTSSGTFCETFNLFRIYNDLSKATELLVGIKKILQSCGIAFIVVQTEHAEIQRLATRHVGSVHYDQHIINLDKAIKSSGFTVVEKYLNQANLTFPRLSKLDWRSIKNRNYNLYYFPNKDVGEAIELMTFIKNPINCINSTELNFYVEDLRRSLHKNDNHISIDEYIYALVPKNCSNASILDSKYVPSEEHIDVASELAPVGLIDQAIVSGVKAIPHGILRGFTNGLSDALLSRGMSKKSSYYLGQLTYYAGFFTMEFASNCKKIQAHEPEINYINAAYNAALETGQLLLVNVALQTIITLFEKSAQILGKRNRELAKRVGLLIPFSIFANNQGIVPTSTAIVAGGMAEVAAAKIFKTISIRPIA